MLLHNQIPRVDSLAELLRFCKRLLQMRMNSIMLPVTGVAFFFTVPVPSDSLSRGPMLREN